MGLRAGGLEEDRWQQIHCHRRSQQAADASQGVMGPRWRSSCLGDANGKQAWERSKNPHGLSYLPPLPLPSPPHHQPQIKLPEYL